MCLNMWNYKHVRKFGGIREDYKLKTEIPCQPKLF